MSTVKNILDRKGTDLATITSDRMAIEAAIRMNEEKIGSLVVVRDGKMIGVVTERDILRKVVAQLSDPKSVPIEKIMTTRIFTCTPETSLDECRNMMASHRIRRLPVLEGEKLGGIVTIGDVLVQTIEDSQAMINLLNEYMGSPPVPAG